MNGSVKMATKPDVDCKTWAIKIPYIIRGERRVFKFNVIANSRRQAHDFAKEVINKRLPVPPNTEFKMRRLST